MSRLFASRSVCGAAVLGPCFLLFAPTAPAGHSNVRLALAPGSTAFGVIPKGKASANHTFTVTNTGTGTSGALTMSVVGQSHRQFVLSNDTCSGQPVLGGGSCSIDVAFAPTSRGMKWAGLRAKPKNGQAIDVPLTGKSGPPLPAALSIAPSPHGFGPQAVGTSSSTQSFMVTNTGSLDSGAIATSLTGADAGQFTASNDACAGRILPGGGNCTIDVAFAPTTTGAKSASVQATAAPGGTVAAGLTGTGANPAVLSVSPTPHGFGTWATGTTSGAQTFTVANSGTGPATALTISLTGADTGQFTISNDTCAGQTLAPSASCTVDAAFAPTSTGVKSASLQATEAFGLTAAASLSGTGATPATLAISPSPHAFGTWATATTSGTQTFTVTNTGGVPSGTVTAGLTGADPGQFTVSADTCTGQTLAPSASCTVNATFAPSSTGAKSAGLQAAATPGGTATASLTGTGATPAALAISPAPFDFATHATGTASAFQTFTVTNTGGVDSGTIAVSLTGADADQFATANDTCTGPALAPSASCTVEVAFVPTSTGLKGATLEAIATPGGTASASLSGTGAPPAALAVSPTPIGFGTYATGTASAFQTFTVTNTGGVDSGTITASLTGTDAGSFTTANDTCTGQVLAAGASCTIDAAFAPASTGAKSASLDATAAPGGTASAGLTGTGAAPAALAVSPSPHDFSLHEIHTTSGAQTFTVTNTGGVDSGTIAVSLAGDDAGEFTTANDTCTGQVLAAGASCTIDAAFAPGSAGTKSASLDATAAPGGNASASLTGTGAEIAELHATLASIDFGNAPDGRHVDGRDLRPDQRRRPSDRQPERPDCSRPRTTTTSRSSAAPTRPAPAPRSKAARAASSPSPSRPPPTAPTAPTSSPTRAQARHRAAWSSRSPAWASAPLRT